MERLNPWSDAPRKKQFPLGAFQQILEESSDHGIYQKESKMLTDEQAESGGDFIEEGLDLLKKNRQLNRDKLREQKKVLMTKYYPLISRSNVENRMKIITDLQRVIKKSNELSLMDKSASSSSRGDEETNNVISIQYHDRKPLLNLLKDLNLQKEALKESKIETLQNLNASEEFVISLKRKTVEVDSSTGAIEDKINALNERKALVDF